MNKYILLALLSSLLLSCSDNSPSSATSKSSSSEATNSSSSNEATSSSSSSFFIDPDSLIIAEINTLDAEEETGMILHYAFNGASDQILDETENYTIKDVSPNILDEFGYNMIETNENTYITLGNILSEDISNGTLELSFKLKESTDSALTQTIFGNTGARMNIILNENQICFVKNTNGIHRNLCYDNNFEADVWYTTKASWGNEGMKLFLDNKLVKEENDDTTKYQATNDSNYSIFYIGHKDICCFEGVISAVERNSYSFNGAVDEIKIWNVQR